jgi:hypothetical protein
VNGHPSEPDLLRASEGGETEATAEHLARCGECGERVAEVRAFSGLARRAYGPTPTGVPSTALERRMADAERRALEAAGGAPAAGAPRSRRFLSPLVGVWATAAAILLAVTVVLWKGETVGFVELQILADRPAGVRAGAAPISEARSGDRYRIRFTLGRPAYVAVLNLDSSREVHLFFPFEEGAGRFERFGLAEPLPGKTSLELPPETHDAYRLDAKPGTEWSFLVASQRRIADADLLGIRRELRALPPEARTPEAVRDRLGARFGQVRTLALEHRP